MQIPARVKALQPLFDILADGWDMVIAIDGNQGESVFWHVDASERQHTLEEDRIYTLTASMWGYGSRKERTHCKSI